jgi:ribosomal protein S18 acetylase RimI-like enzyme
VVVLPSFQGRGLGRKLIAHAERVAASSGFREVRLYTNKAFVENVHFYSRLGYRIDREETFTGDVAIHMSKPV